MDHDLGTSTFSCLKITLPASSVISAMRRSHSIWSNGATLASLNVLRTGSDWFMDAPWFRARRETAIPVDLRRPVFAGADTTSSLTSIMIIPLILLGSPLPPKNNLKRRSQSCQAQNLLSFKSFRASPGGAHPH